MLPSQQHPAIKRQPHREGRSKFYDLHPATKRKPTVTNTFLPHYNLCLLKQGIL